MGIEDSSQCDWCAVCLLCKSGRTQINCIFYKTSIAGDVGPSVLHIAGTYGVGKSALMAQLYERACTAGVAAIHFCTHGDRSGHLANAFRSNVYGMYGSSTAYLIDPPIRSESVCITIRALNSTQEHIILVEGVFEWDFSGLGMVRTRLH